MACDTGIKQQPGDLPAACSRLPLLWQGIPDGATGYISRLGPASDAAWAEDPAICTYRLDALEGRLTPIPLESTFGCGTAQFEWFDLAKLTVASIQLVEVSRILGMHRVVGTTGRASVVARALPQ